MIASELFSIIVGVLVYGLFATLAYTWADYQGIDDETIVPITLFWPITFLTVFLIGCWSLLKWTGKGLSGSIRKGLSFRRPMKGMLAKGVPSPTYVLCGMLAQRMLQYPLALNDWNSNWSKDDVIIVFERGRYDNSSFKVESLQVGQELIDLREHKEAEEELVKAHATAKQLKKEKQEENARIEAEKKSTNAIEHLLKIDPPLKKIGVMDPVMGVQPKHTYETPCTLSCCKGKKK